MKTPVISAPHHLMCDLAEHTESLFVAGEVSNFSVENANDLIEESQSILICRYRPILSWMLGCYNGLISQQIYQTSFQVILSSSREFCSQDKGDLWDSGTVTSQDSLVKYAGRLLRPDKIYYWKVKITDSNNNESSWSPINFFKTGPELSDYASVRYPLVQKQEFPLYNKEINSGLILYDFGKAAAGKLKLTVFSKTSLARISIHLGESLLNNGRVDRNPGASIRYKKIDFTLIEGEHNYTVSPEKFDNSERSWISPMPKEIGEVSLFRYCEIEIENKEKDTIKIHDVTRKIVHYPFNDSTSSFESSNTVLNDVWNFCKYSVKATSYTGLYIDGDRERTPYEADSYINQLCHYSVDREFTMARASMEFIIFDACWPTEWLLLTIHLAWIDYYYTGDISFLERYYIDLKNKALLPLIDRYGFISTRTGKITDSLYDSVHLQKDRFPFPFRDNVDYPFPGILGIPETEKGEIDGFVYTDYNSVINAYFFRTLTMLTEIAEALGNKNDVILFQAKAKTVKQNFNKHFFIKDKKIYRDGLGTDHSSLHANMFALCFGLVPKEHVNSVMEYIKTRGMACSVFGSQFLLDAIYLSNDASYGLELMTATHNRSWAHMIYDIGSTITLEAWDKKYKPNLDWNHAWGAAPANIIPRRLIGIEPLLPGFKKMRIKPQIGDLKWINGQFPTIKGDITIEITNKPKQKFVMIIKVPLNVELELWLPFWKNNLQITQNGKPIKAKTHNHFAIIENALSATYKIEQ